jgi:uncharacterized MAPEG superfamily protein
MTDSFTDATLEIAAANGAAVFVVFTSAKWGEYLGEPGNVVSLIVSIGAMVFTVVRTRYYIQQKQYAREDREEAKRIKKQQQL